jgi:hypothetical protein
MKNQTDIERAFWGTLRTSGAAKPPFPNCSPSMKAPEQDALFEDLEDWERWAVDRYELDYRTIPPCWARHGALVEELFALHSAWLTVFQPSSRGDAPMTWHDGFAKARLRPAESGHNADTPLTCMDSRVRQTGIEGARHMARVRMMSQRTWPGLRQGWRRRRSRTPIRGCGERPDPARPAARGATPR